MMSTQGVGPVTQESYALAIDKENGAQEPGVKDRKFVVALARGLEVLRSFRVHDGFLGNQEIAERTGLPRPTVTRLTYTLCELGYLTQIPRTGKYQLAPSAVTLGYSALANLGIRQVARPHMDQAADKLDAPIAMGMADRNRALYIDISRGYSTFTVQLDIGSRVPLAMTSMGWAIIAVTPQAKRDEMFERFEIRYGRDWPGFRGHIEGAIREYAEKGYVTNHGVWRSDIYSVGIPLIASDGSGIFAFNCGGPPHQFTEERLDTVYGPAIVEMVKRIHYSLNEH